MNKSKLQSLEKMIMGKNGGGQNVWVKDQMTDVTKG